MTPIEKAMATERLASETGMTVLELSTALNLPTRTVKRYVDFYSLMNKERFIESRLNIDWAPRINQVRNLGKRITENVLSKTFTSNDSKKLENAIISRIIRGEFNKFTDITKLKDAFRKDPKIIQQVIDGNKETAEEIFERSNAKGAYYLRNLMAGLRTFVVHGKNFLKVRDIKINNTELTLLKYSKKIIEELIGIVE